MSLIKKVVLSYAKSLFQNVNASKPSNDVFEVSNITTKETNTFVPNIYVIAEELL